MDSITENSAARPGDIPLIRRIFGLGYTDLATFEERRTYLRIALQIAFPVTLIFSLLNYLEGHALLGLIEFSVAVTALSASYKLLDSEAHIDLAENIAIVYGLIITTALATLGGIENSGPLWVIAFPFFAFFIKRQRGGWISCGIWWLVQGLSFLLFADQAWAWNYSFEYDLQIAYMLGFYTLLAAAFNLVRNDFEIRIKNKNLQLQAAQAEALKASEAKAEFLARMSHEIRNPLNAVIGFSQILKDNPNAPDQTELLETVNLSSRHLLTLVDDILSFSKLDSDALELETIEFDLHSMLEGVISMLSPTAHEKSLEFALLLHTDLPVWINGDPNRLTQVVTNLASNALKFTDKGHVFIEAELIERDDQFQIEISINDTGIGMDDEQLSRLFQPFAQADSSISRRFGGTGLGLHISKRLVELMHGDIRVESRKNRGSRFIISLPAQRSTPPHTNDLTGLEERSVLIYDAKPITRRCLRTTTSSWNMQVTNLSNLNLVYARLKDSVIPPPEILLLSLDSIEREPTKFGKIYREIRKNYSGPLLVLIDSEEWEAPEQLHDSSNLFWIAKPARRTTLFEKIRSILDDTPTNDALDEVAPVNRVPLPGSDAKSVLLVDDQAINRQLMRRYLQGFNLNIYEAKNGLEAIQLASQRQPELIFMDIHMPDMSGIEAARTIRKRHARPLQIISLTADVFMENQAAADSEENIFDQLMLKPVSEARIREAVITALGAEIERVSGRPETSESISWNELDQSILAELTTLLKAAEANLAATDWEGLKSVAHRLKGIAGLYQIQDITEQVSNLSLRITQRDSDGSERILRKLANLLSIELTTP